MNHNEIPALTTKITNFLHEMKHKKHISHTPCKYLLPKNPSCTPPPKSLCHQQRHKRTTLEALSHHPINPLLPPLNDIQKILEFILKYNYYTFNNKHYLQTQGTVMAIWMVVLLTQTSSWPHWKNNSRHCPWMNQAPRNTHTQIKHSTFLQYINSFHIMYDTSRDSISFLDTTIHITADRKLH